MIQVQINESQLLQLAKEKIGEAIKQMDSEFVYWDVAELMKRTCMSWNFIQDQFFFDPRFPKHKIGKKWYFPAKQTREFLETWLSERSTC